LVVTSRPAYSCILSAFTTSPPSATATSIDSFVLPVPVAPTITTSRVVGSAPALPLLQHPPSPPPRRSSILSRRGSFRGATVATAAIGERTMVPILLMKLI
jgi:hypothetical protein